MYLKEIETMGFKSFADKINIKLDNNITCVVGPNGSGKSNIVDAIRWVLGEQSVKSLRGENNMSDVIFSGSKSRKPLNVASVMLTFDNTDHYLNIPYDNVSIKRRVYRSGENEYFLNGEKCRLKDITELFLDTGIGKNSFNIISQGEINRILSNSAMERRSILEEAAGILKYKTRREEALRKLDKTMNNILRVNDIINELEGRVEPLKQQSEAARIYLDTKDKLKEIEVSLLAHEINNINNELIINKRKISSLNEEVLSLNTILSNNELENKKIKSLEMEKEISSLNSKLVDLTREEEELNGKRNIIKERSKYNSQDSKIYENIANLKEYKLSLETEINLLKKDLEDNLKNKDDLKNKVNNLVSNLNNFKLNKDNLNKEYEVKQRDYQEKINRINIIKDNLDNNLLVNNNVKRILSNPRLNGVYDALGNVIETKKEYEKALSVSLASSKNFIIVENEESAKECINFLKNNNLGRATFFPLNVIKGKYLDNDTKDKIIDDIDYLGILSDFLDYDDKYKNIIDNQFSNIIVVNDLDAATRISKIINNRYKIVTLMGDVIHVGGSISGGSFNNNTSTNPISLKNELNEITFNTQTLKTVLDEIKSSLSTINQDIIKLEENIYKERGEYLKKEEIINNLNNNIKEKEISLKNIFEELSNLEDVSNNKLGIEEEKVNQEYYNKKEERELLIKEINNKNISYDNLKGEIFNLEADVKLLNNKIKDKERIIKDLEIENSRMDSKLDNDLNILNADYELTFETARDNYELLMDEKDAKVMVNKYKNELKNIGMVNLHAIKEFEEVNTRYEFLINQRNDLLNAKETLNSIIEEMDDVMKEDFLNTFKLLQVEFQKVFRMLFNGGHATLKLTDPTDLLTTGVDIVAEPPGKSLKAITLLSGGEKTLTAISLLFAILNIRKVPFCIFDEIEAALDENNVDIFGHYLDNYKDKTQFLLITHKKRTMEYAKTLYGITMQESGVSKLVSVKLEG